MGALQSLFRGSTVDATLDDEILEEIKMVQSVFQDKDILELYARFHDADTSNSGYLTREAFSSMPEFENNPLKERIFSLLDVHKDGQMRFKEFVLGMSWLNIDESRDQKLRFLFRIYDVDEDNKISKRDLECILELIMIQDDDPPDEVATKKQTIQQVAEKTMQEASSDEFTNFLSYDDFVAVVSQTDFEGKMSVNIATLQNIERQRKIASLPSTLSRITKKMDTQEKEIGTAELEL